MTMLRKTPTSSPSGVPLRRPVDGSKSAQRGLFEIENESESPPASNAEGVKAYSAPCSTLRLGDPEIVGGVFCDGAVTSIENGPSTACSAPSLAAMTMPSYVPTSSSPGSPASSPVDASKLAQAGAFSTLKISVSPSRSDAVGMNAYSVPAATVAGGSPDIDGGVFTVASRTTISNGGSVVVARPSVTAITTSR